MGKGNGNGNGNIAFTDIQIEPLHVIDVLNELRAKFPEYYIKRVMDPDQNIMVSYDPKNLDGVRDLVNFINSLPGVIQSRTRIGILQHGKPAEKIPKEPTTCWMFMRVKGSLLNPQTGIDPKVIQKLAKVDGVLQIATLAATHNLAVLFEFDRNDLNDMYRRQIEIIIIIIVLDDIIIIVMDT